MNIATVGIDLAKERIQCAWRRCARQGGAEEDCLARQAARMFRLSAALPGGHNEGAIIKK